MYIRWPSKDQTEDKLIPTVLNLFTMAWFSMKLFQSLDDRAVLCYHERPQKKFKERRQKVWGHMANSY